MKIAIVVLLMSGFAWAGKTSTPNPAEYNTNIHVSASRYVFYANLTFSHLDVSIGGKKYELECPLVELLALGDYKAKLVQDEHKTAYESIQTYEFLFPDNKTLKYKVVAQTE
jgi:hypothetical protein